MPDQIIVTPTQLNNFLHDKTDACPVYYDAVSFCLRLQLFTGCRAMEAVDLERWSVIGNQVVLLATLKNNNPRSFTLDLLPPDFLTWIADITYYKANCNYRRTQYVFNNLTKHYGITTGNKSALLHLYRYNYIKLLSSEGMSAEQIQIMMGHKEVASTEFYINAVIVSQYNLSL